MKTEKRLAEQRIRRHGVKVESRLDRLRKLHFKKYDDLLDTGDYGPTWLQRSVLADIVVKALQYRDQRVYDLIAWCVMPNHVHLVFETNAEYAKHGKRGRSPYWVTNILENLKWYTAKECNKVLKQKGRFWQSESYDHVVRQSEELDRIVRYVMNNPVKSGLVNGMQEYKYYWCLEKFEM
ncbi:MAG: transposase [candidate division KSB1 bacterium]|nr:transposase [candidate division KSB1 bacterium]